MGSLLCEMFGTKGGGGAVCVYGLLGLGIAGSGVCDVGLCGW